MSFAPNKGIFSLPGLQQPQFQVPPQAQKKRGLMDLFAEGNRQQLLGLGIGLLQGSAESAVPGQGTLGAGLAQGFSNYQQQDQLEQQRKFREAQATQQQENADRSYGLQEKRVGLEEQRMNAPAPMTPDQRNLEWANSLPEGDPRKQAIMNKYAPRKGINVNVGQQSPMKITDSLKLQNAEGKNPPLGMSLNEAIMQGYQPVSNNQQKASDDVKGATEILGQLNDYVDTLWGEDTGSFITDRVIEGGERKLGSITQQNPDAAAYDSFKKGTMAPIIRALGEKGTLSDGDVTRALQLTPNLTDNKEVAQKKLAQIKKIFEKVSKSKNFEGKGKKIDWRNLSQEELEAIANGQ